MAKKMVKEVKEVLDNAIVQIEESITQESLLDETLAIDTDKLAKDLEQMKKEIFEDVEIQTPQKIEAKVEPDSKEEDVKINVEENTTDSKEEVVSEQIKEVCAKNNKKTLKSRVVGLMWNGQEYDY